jgi:DNA (cytosine-5)-methyltransferase 1
MTALRVLDLFSGIGGFSLGLERTGGFETVAFCEIDPFCRRVLAKHWPNVRQYEDVRDLTAERLAADGIAVDVICGGFPCQDISHAGLGAGMDGARSGLWSEYARLVGELRPRFVLVENVAALLGRGLERVLGDLAALGFDAEWHCIPASAVGAPHRRDRVWIVANAGSGRRGEQSDREDQQQGRTEAVRPSEDVAHPARDVRPQQAPRWAERQRVGQSCEPILVADAAGERSNGRVGGAELARRRQPANSGEALADADIGERTPGWAAGRMGRLSFPRHAENNGLSRGDDWLVEPDVGRVAHGVPNRVHRLRALGNAVVPQIPELIGNAILASTTHPIPYLNTARAE